MHSERQLISLDDAIKIVRSSLLEATGHPDSLLSEGEFSYKRGSLEGIRFVAYDECGEHEKVVIGVKSVAATVRDYLQGEHAECEFTNPRVMVSLKTGKVAIVACDYRLKDWKEIE